MQELFPLFGFIGAYLAAKWTGNGSEAIYWATGALMVFTIIQLAALHFSGRKIEQKQLWTTVLIIVMGSATFFFHNPLIIKWKLTISYLIFASILFIFPWAGKGILLEKMLGQVLEMPQILWKRLNIAWIVFFIVMAIVNLIVAYGFSDDFWFAFKLWGGLGGMVVFMIGQMVLLRRYLKQEDDHE